jgi:hypothetical protein
MNINNGMEILDDSGRTTCQFALMLYTKCPTAWTRVLLDKLLVTLLFNTFLASYGVKGFITVITRARHWVQV